ncbi:MAG: hypothetical protein KGJ13_07025 [Patescibacteria group bacterium]|nr:hypothetical protein [Patescibacteria group bacterium]
MSASPVIKPKITRQVPVQLPAATTLNGQIVPTEAAITQAGDRFYVLATSGNIQIQPVRAGAVGVSNSFSTGQGQPVEGGFDTLTVKNFSLYSCVALIWVGFDDFINDQLIIANSSYSNAVYPTYSQANSAASVAIKDLSGQTFLDINGKKWGAISRVAIEVFNLDTGITLLLQKSGSLVSNGPAVGAIYPGSPIKFEYAGDYTLNLGGSNINAIVSEIYLAIPF